MKKDLERCFHYIVDIEDYLKRFGEPFCKNRECDGYNTKCPDYLIWHRRKKK